MRRMGRMAKGHYHDWVNRDYLEIDCRAVGCKLNVGGKCAAPSGCEIGPDGKCKGFLAEAPREKEGA